MCVGERAERATSLSDREERGREGGGKEGREEGREKEGREDHMVGRLPPLAECGYIPVRLFRKLW